MGTTHADSVGGETLLEEIANAVTHGIGAVLSIAGLAVLVALAAIEASTWTVVCVAIFGATLVFAYLSSTLYHSVWHDAAKRVLQVFDHCTIFLLIAGTYTPVALLVLRDEWGWVMFGIVWGFAATGILLRVVCRRCFDRVHLALYLPMGWLGVGWINPVIEGIGLGGSGLLLGGGLAYTAGVGFYVWESLPFNHAVWHLFVLAGSVCHFFAMALYIIPISG